MKIRIQTAQNVEIEYEVAGLGYRVLAALIDLAIFIGYYALLYIILVPLQFEPPDWMIYVLVAPPVPIVLYPLVCEVFLDGQTVGKSVMNLKVVRIDGTAPSLGAYLLRWIFWIVEASPFAAISGLGAVSIVSVVSTRYGQRVGDLAAGTTVVRLQKDEASRPLELGIGRFSPDYSPVFPTARRLSSEQVATMREVVDAVEKGGDDSLYTPLAYGVAGLLGVEPDSIGVPSEFVRRVIDDYVYLGTASTGTSAFGRI